MFLGVTCVSTADDHPVMTTRRGSSTRFGNPFFAVVPAPVSEHARIRTWSPRPPVHPGPAWLGGRVVLCDLQWEGPLERAGTCWSLRVAAWGREVWHIKERWLVLYRQGFLHLLFNTSLHGT